METKHCLGAVLAGLLCCGSASVGAIPVPLYDSAVTSSTDSARLVQTGTFKAKFRAENMAHELRTKGYSSAQIFYYRELYHVVVVPEEGEAKKILEQLKLKYKDAYLRNAGSHLKVKAPKGKVPIVG